MSNELLKKAIEQFGENVVYVVKEVVEISDPDDAYTMFEDLGQYEHAECVEFLYFNN